LSTDMHRDAGMHDDVIQFSPGSPVLFAVPRAAIHSVIHLRRA